MPNAKSILMVLAPVDFRDEEFLEPREVFEEQGFRVIVASKGVKEAKGKLGAVVPIDKDISAVSIDEYDAVVFVGGPGAAVYFEDSEVLSMAKEAYEKGKVVAAICIAPSILANAGVLEAKKATSFHTQRKNLEESGTEYTGNEVEVDENIITASGPQASVRFATEIVEALLAKK